VTTDQLIGRAISLLIKPGECFQVHLRLDGQVESHCLTTLQEFCQRWRGTEGIAEIRRQAKLRPGLAWIGILHRDGIYAVGFQAAAVEATR
jgi:hypothetical protein